MQDHELYAAILGIQSPWRVESVELQLELGEVHVRLAHTEGEAWPCAECGSLCRLYDHQGERRWRHLDTRQYRTILHAEPPRSECPNMG
jgi:transposase